MATANFWQYAEQQQPQYLPLNGKHSDYVSLKSVMTKKESKDKTPREVLQELGYTLEDHFREYAKQDRFKYSTMVYITDCYYKEYPQMKNPDEPVK